MKKKTANLQPWLDYFKMLQQYAAKGFLEVKAADNEAYITMPALFTLAGVREEDIDNGTFLSYGESKALDDTVTRIRAYAAFLKANIIGQQHQVGTKGQAAPLPAMGMKDCFEQPFALHVVGAGMPHELLHTILLTPKRNRREKVEIISYSN